ncbi:MAG: TVP38/TMEM64 family protein [Bacillota bacterium]
MFKKTGFKILIASIMFLLLYLFWEDIQALQIQKIVNDIDNTMIASLIILGAFSIKSLFFFLPLFLIFISAGMILPVIPAALLSILGITIEFSLTYLYGYFLGTDLVENIVSRSSKFEEILKYRSSNNIKVAFFFRLVPVMPEAVSLVLGATGNNYIEYILASVMGIIPKLLIFVSIGNAIVNPISQMDIIVFIGSILIWLVALKLFQVNGKKNNQENNKLQTE